MEQVCPGQDELLYLFQGHGRYLASPGSLHIEIQDLQAAYPVVALHQPAVDVELHHVVVVWPQPGHHGSGLVVHHQRLLGIDDVGLPGNGNALDHPGETRFHHGAVGLGVLHDGVSQPSPEAPVEILGWHVDLQPLLQHYLS